MNKDVIYIEPEQDITDIIANIKASKHKIIALVPPKKAGVLRSAVNFKLIAKTARQNEKTVVLITTDEALHRLANSVAMPTAKSLQSKPQLPEDDDAEEFGEEETADATVDDDENEEPEEAAEDAKKETKDDSDEEPEAKEESKDEDSAKEKAPKSAGKKIPVTAAVKVTKKKAAPAPAPVEDDVIEGEPEPEEEKAPQTKAEKNVAKMKGAKIPNFAKYRKYIITGILMFIVIFAFSFWATIIAPYAKIYVKVHTTAKNFTEKVYFVNDESKSKPKEGVFFYEEQTIKKSAEGEFTATGKVDKGTKATGKVTITRPKGERLTDSNVNFSIPKGATFTIEGKEYTVSDGGSININIDTQAVNKCTRVMPCYELKADYSATVNVVAKENGEGYNIAAATKGITSSLKMGSNYSVSSTTMTGGSSKVVTVVSAEDVETAASDLEMPSQNEIREELANQFGADYIFLGSLKQSEPKITTSPALNEEVGDNITPKVVKEITYTMLAVKREPVKTYIEAVASADLKGDDTQTIYDTGIDKAFFEAFQNSDNENTAKLKTTIKIGPRVTDEMVRKKALGAKVGEVQSKLKSINGVSSVKIDTSYFFVMSVPADTNKVEVTIELEE